MTGSWWRSRRRGPRRESRARQRIALGLLVMTMMAGMMPMTAGVATAASCEIPRAAAARGLDAAKASGPTPAAGTDVIEVEAEAGTPPAASDATAVAPLDPAVALNDDLTAVAEALAACLSAGNAEMVTALAGERYLGQLFGSSVPMSSQEYVAIAGQLTPVPTRIVGLAEVTAADAAHATARVTHIVGNQLMEAEWSFEQAPRGEREAGQSTWRIAGERQAPAAAPRGAAEIDVVIGHYSFTLDRTAIEGPDVVLHGENRDSDDHEMLVLRLAPGYTTADLLRASGPDLPAEVTYIGEIPVRAGASRDLVLVDLDPGVYTVLCLFTDPEGTPHLAYGMEAEFTVE